MSEECARVGSRFSAADNNDRKHFEALGLVGKKEDSIFSYTKSDEEVDIREKVASQLSRDGSI